MFVEFINNKFYVEVKSIPQRFFYNHSMDTDMDKDIDRCRYIPFTILTSAGSTCPLKWIFFLSVTINETKN